MSFGIVDGSSRYRRAVIQRRFGVHTIIEQSAVFQVRIVSVRNGAFLGGTTLDAFVYVAERLTVRAVGRVHRTVDAETKALVADALLKGGGSIAFLVLYQSQGFKSGKLWPAAP
jgi:hypothetical protein